MPIFTNSLLAYFCPDVLLLPITNGECCTSDAVQMGICSGCVYGEGGAFFQEFGVRDHGL